MTWTIPEMLELAILRIKGKSLREACNEFHRNHPDRPKPLHTFCYRVTRRLMKTGSVMPLTAPGAKRTATDGTNVRRLEVLLQSDPATSVQSAATTLGISVGSVANILKREGYKSYTTRPVHTLFTRDYGQRFEFCDWFKHRLQSQPTLSADIFFSDESTFYVSAPRGYQHGNQWHKENPLIFYTTSRQGSGKVNVWCGLHGENLIGPVFLSEKMNATSYLTMLQEVLPSYLDSLSLSVVSRTMFQQDGAPPHIAKRVTTWLDEMFPLQWIGSKGPFPWPPRSPDLTPLDTFLWGYLKRKVYHPKPNTIEELKQNIISACREISKTTLQSVHNNIVRRIDMCHRQEGGIFEHLL